VGLKLILEYLTISPSSESLSSTLIHYSSSGNILKPEYITHDPSLVPSFTHLYGTHLPETSIRKTFDTGSNCTCPSHKLTALIPLAGKIRGEILGRSQTVRHEPTCIREWHHLQPKALRFWVEGDIIPLYGLAFVSFLWDLPGFSPQILPASGIRADDLRLGWVQFDLVSKVFLM